MGAAASDPPEPPHKPPKRTQKTRWWLLVPVLAYAGATAVSVVLLQFFVDRFWGATVLAFMPRWAPALPAPLLLVVAAYVRDPRAVGITAACLVAQLFWIGGLRVSVGHGAPKDRSLRVMTQNADRVPFSSGWVAKVVKAEDLDLLVVQECPLANGVATPSPLEGYAFETDINTCVLSRYPISKTDLRPRKDVWAHGGSGAISLYEIDAPFGTFGVMNVHFATARNGLDGFRQFGIRGGINTTKENMELRQWESGLARDWSARTTAPLLVMGDFNMPVESQIYRASWGDLGNAFDACGNGFGYSKETVVRGIEYGTRIDHVLFDSRWACHAARLGPEMGSDHRGMFAELSLK